KMVAQEIVTQRPVTVFKTVPMGSSLAFGAPAAAPTTTTALQPTPNSEATAILPKGSSKNSAPERTAKRPEPLNSGDDEDAFENRELKKKSGSIKAPAARDDGMTPVSDSDEQEIASRSERPIGKWVARKKTKSASGPAFPEVAQTGKVRA